MHNVIDIQLEVSDELLNDIIDTVNTASDVYSWAHKIPGYPTWFIESSGNSPLKFEVTQSLIIDGLRTMLSATSDVDEGTRSLLLESVIMSDASNIDADISDRIVQYSVFGKQVYC